MDGRLPPRPRPSLLFRRLRALLLLALLIVLVSTAVQLARGRSGPVSTPAASVAAPRPTPSPTALIEAALQDWDAEGGGRLALAVADLDAGTTTEYGDSTHEFATASVVKVNILAALLLQTDGQLSDRERTLAKQMITVSSNGAATTLWREIGRAKGLAKANAELGLTSTRGGSASRWGTTTTTAADQLRLLRVVLTDDSPLTPQARDYARSLMGSVAKDQDWGVSAADDRPGREHEVKNGWLPRTGGWVVNSIGAVEHDGHDLLIVALSEGGETQKQSIKAVELVAKQGAAAITAG